MHLLVNKLRELHDPFTADQVFMPDDNRSTNLNAHTLSAQLSHILQFWQV